MSGNKGVGTSGIDAAQRGRLLLLNWVCSCWERKVDKSFNNSHRYGLMAVS